MFANEHAYDDIVVAASVKYAVPVPLIKAVIGAESSFVNGRKSSSSYGLMQLYPPTARTFRPGVTELQLQHDAALNVDIGTAYLRRLLNQFGSDLAAVASAYNAGPGNATRWAKAGRFCLEWKGGTKPANAVLDRDCARIVAVNAGDFPNQGYVDKVMGLVQYFQPPGSPPVATGSGPAVSPGLLSALLGFLLTLLGIRWTRRKRA